MTRIAMKDVFQKFGSWQYAGRDVFVAKRSGVFTRFLSSSSFASLSKQSNYPE